MIVTLSVKCRNAESHFAKCNIFYCYAECHYAECRWAQCRYAERHYPQGCCASYNVKLSTAVIDYTVVS